jgi:hypothetical protein
MEAEKATDTYEKSFIEVPAILDKHAAAGVVCDGKKNNLFCNCYQ